MLSNLFNNLTIAVYRRTENAKHVKTRALSTTCTGKIGGYSNGSTDGGQYGMSGYTLYTSGSVIAGDKLIIDGKNYIVGSVTPYKSNFEEYNLCIINASNGD